MQRKEQLRREDWVIAARDLLITGGIEHVRTVRLSEKLNVTRGAFYWLFKSREDLLSEVLKHWERNNTRPFEEILDAGHNGVEELKTLFDLWLSEKKYIPAYDSAIRDWARVSKKAARVVKRVDNKRIELFKTIFLRLGHEEEEAFIRARVAYFHQVGYYTLGLGESMAARVKLRPLYMKVLSGRDDI